MDEKIALCFMISGKHILNKEEIWREWINVNKDIINVYFHYEKLSKISSNWIRDKAIPQVKTVRTSYYHMVPAYMTLLDHAISQDARNKWFCFLTDSCAPIVSPTKFKEIFIKNSEKSVFTWSNASWNSLFNKRANLKYLPEEYRLCHDPWFTLTKIDAECCLRFIKERPDVYLKICAGIIANESIFAIILKFYKRLRFVVNGKGHIADFQQMSSPTSPHVFQYASLQDIKYLISEREKNEHAMFVRKVAVEFPDKVLRGLALPSLATIYA